MISHPDREKAVELIDEAVAAGSRRAPACETLGICERTYRRWRRSEREIVADGRPGAERQAPANKLTPEEREQILALCHKPEFANLPPGQIVPVLADQGEYVASESSFYRILHDADEQHHRGRAKVPFKSRPRSTHCASAPCQVWTWDVTFLKAPVRGMFYYLYMILDIYSRKVVGWEVHEQELGTYASALVRRAVLSEHCDSSTLVLHADNGSIQKSATLRSTLEWLGIEPSYSRPRVSDDNAYSEAAFRTCKYRPEFPVDGFESLVAAREWVDQFVHWYNTIHRHSGIKYVTPEQRHRGEDIQILAERQSLYEQAKKRNPHRWSGSSRDWSPVTAVWLNPEKPEAEKLLEIA